MEVSIGNLAEERVTNLVILDPSEDDSKEMVRQISAAEANALSVVIGSDEDLKIAGDLARTIKTFETKVKDYWEPLRKSAKQNYDNILAKKKEMLSPLEHAELIVKNKMDVYMRQREEERIKKERELQEAKERAAEKALIQALEAEKAGDKEAAESAMADVEAFEGSTVRVINEKPKMDGVSFSKGWKILECNIDVMPDTIDGMKIVKRSPDTTAILNIIKMKNGKVTIPGVVFEETYRSAVSSRK